MAIDTPEQIKTFIEQWQRENPWYVAGIKITPTPASTFPNVITDGDELHLGLITLHQKQGLGEQQLQLTYRNNEAVLLNVGGITMTKDQVFQLILDLHKKQGDVKLELLMDDDNTVIQCNIAADTVH